MKTATQIAAKHIRAIGEDTEVKKRLPETGEYVIVISVSGLEYAMKEYARIVAEQVRQECAEKAVSYILPEDMGSVVSGTSILSVNIEQFIK